MPPLTSIKLVKALLVERNLRQNDRVPIFGTEIASEVLSGKPELQAKHIEALANFFHVSPAVFLAASVPLVA